MNNTKFFKDVAIQSIRHRCGNICGICGETLGDDAVVDHIIPVLYGGSDNIDNLRMVHAACHCYRHGKLRGMDIAEENIRREMRAKKERKKHVKSSLRQEIEKEQVRRIKEMKDSGRRITTIAREVNLSRPTIYDYLKKADLYFADSGNA